MKKLKTLCVGHLTQRIGPFNLLNSWNEIHFLLGTWFEPTTSSLWQWVPSNNEWGIKPHFAPPINEQIKILTWLFRLYSAGISTGKKITSSADGRVVLTESLNSKKFERTGRKRREIKMRRRFGKWISLVVQLTAGDQNILFILLKFCNFTK